MKLHFEHRVAAPREEVFHFHEDPSNLAVLLAGWRTFRLIDHRGSILPGSVTAISEHLLGIPFRMEFEHDLHEPPVRFGEHQTQGPFERFVHVHEFLSAEGGTLVRDSLEVRLRSALGGELVTRALVAPRMRRFFRCRHRALDRIFGRLASGGG